MAGVSQLFDPSSDDMSLNYWVSRLADTVHRELANMDILSALSLEANARILQTARTNIRRLSQLLEARTIMEARSIFYRRQIPGRIIRRQMGPSVLFVPLSLTWRIHPHRYDNKQEVKDAFKLYNPVHRVFEQGSNYVHSMIL